MPARSLFADARGRRLAGAAGTAFLALLHLGVLLVLAGLVERDAADLQPGSGPGGLPAAPPALIGTVGRLGTDAFVAETYAEERPVRLRADTAVIRRDGTPARFADLRPGAGVIAWGEAAADRALEARTIVVAPPS